MTDNERVLCVPSEIVDAYALNTVDEAMEVFLQLAVHKPRKTDGDYPGCENDPSFRQLIPYIVVRNRRGRILCYQRKNGGEKRLDAKWSIGIGGHVNDGDSGWLGGVIREIREELSGVGVVALTGNGIGPESSLHGPIGFIRDDSDAVGRVHLGVLYVLDVPDGVTYREEGDAVWSSYPEVIDDLETWSKLAMQMVRAWERNGGE